MNEIAYLLDEFMDSLRYRYMYELISQNLRNSIKSDIEIFLRERLTLEFIKNSNLNIICDETNNSPEVVDKGNVIITLKSNNFEKDLIL